jgi:uncharacterized protein YjbI with pentapeptide repeats
MKEETEYSSAGEPEEPLEPRRAQMMWIGRSLVWIGGIATLALVLGVVGVILYGYQAKPGWIGVSGKKFWDYLELLIVPAALALGVYWLNRTQGERERKAQEAQEKRERKAEAERREREREAQAAQRERELVVENQRAQDAALEAYLDQMSQLLTDKARPLHRAQLHDSLSTAARARTLAVLPRLNGHRKGSVLQFLHEAGLVTKDRLILDLSGADLSGADLSGVQLSKDDLSWADLSDADLSKADLSEADLSKANLREACLRRAGLSGANLHAADLFQATPFQANLIRADLSKANLREACLREANLQGANLSEASPRGADLSWADLSDADLSKVYLLDTDLSHANLNGASGVTIEELAKQARSLKGAIIHGLYYEDYEDQLRGLNGLYYEDGLQDKESSGEDGENSGPS